MYSLNPKQVAQIKDKCFNRGNEISSRGWELPIPRKREIIPSISEITSTFCKSKRDIYLKYILEVEAVPSKAMTVGGMCHAIVAHIFKRAKGFQEGEFEYDELVEYCAELKNDRDLIEEIIWEGNQLENLKKFCEESGLNYDVELEEMITWLQTIVDYEISRIKHNWTLIIDKSYNINIVEGWADASILETRWGKIDFIGNLDEESIIFDLKTGSSYGDNFGYKLQITAYALALEKSLKNPINIGCLVFPLKKADKSPIEEPVLDFFFISDEIREAFFERRDVIFKILEGDKLPEIIDTFPCQWCGYNFFCNKDGGDC